jgi:hypothetical protein
MLFYNGYTQSIGENPSQDIFAKQAEPQILL